MPTGPLPYPARPLLNLPDPRWYPAVIESVPDGDTVVVTIDRGHDQISRRQSIRLRGIDTAESGDPDPNLAKLGRLAAVVIRQLLPTASAQYVLTYKTPKSKREEIEKFGRFQGDFVLSINAFEGGKLGLLTEYLVENRLAVRYHGQSKTKIAADHLNNYHHHKDRGSFAHWVI
jgi:hypothetical protein